MTPKTVAVLAIALWAVTAAAVGFKFVQGSTVEAADGREAIVLTAGERDFILAEMRGMLAAVQEIVAAVNAGDTEAVQRTAHRVGVAEVEGVPPATMLKLPMVFKQLGRATHAGFDDIALAAEVGPGAALALLEENLARCVGCHEAYSLTAQ